MTKLISNSYYYCCTDFCFGALLAGTVKGNEASDSSGHTGSDDDESPDNGSTDAGTGSHHLMTSALALTCILLARSLDLT